MAVETSQDRLTYLNDFGEDVIFGANTITAIFDNPHSDISAGGEVPFSMQECFIMARSSDVSSLGQGSSVEIRGDDYVVRDVQPDGTGITTIFLEAQ